MSKGILLHRRQPESPGSFISDPNKTRNLEFVNFRMTVCSHV